MPTRHARASVSRTTLIWLVVASVLMASGIGVYFSIRTSPPGATPQGANVNLDPPPPAQGTVLPPVPTTASPEGSFSGENGRAQFADKDDPTRLAGEMLYRRFDPLPRGRYALEQVQLWLFAKDGRTLHVEAARGNVKFFSGTQNKPESGRFEGGVVVRVYAPGVATASRRPDPGVTPPEMLAYSDSVVFDLSVGEITTPDVINLSTRDMELQGEGLEVVIDEVRESVASVKLGAIGYLHVRAGAKGGRSEQAGGAQPTAPSAGEPAKPVAATEPAKQAPQKIDLYTITIGGPIALTVGTKEPQTITSDTLLAWARLIGGKLPEDAVAQLGAPRQTTPPPPPSSASAGTPAPAVATGAATSPGVAPGNTPATIPSMRERVEKLRVLGPSGLVPLTPVNDEDVLLTWGGQLVATAVQETPAELEKEHVAVRFVSQSDAPVTMTDSRSGATVLCNSAHYAATSANVTLLPSGTAPVTIADARQGFGELRGLELNLKSGIGQSRGAGFFTRNDAATSKDAKGIRQRLAWKDQVDLEFATGTRGGAGLEAVRFAMFSGEVSASSGEAEVTGDVLRAWFQPGRASDALLHRVVVEGKAVGKTTGTPEPQSLAATRFDLTFAQDAKGEQSYPDVLVAAGGVKGSRTEQLPSKIPGGAPIPQTSDLSCDDLEARLTRDAKGNTLVSDAVARGKAVFSRTDGVFAAGDIIHAMVSEDSVDISGPSASVAARGGTLRNPELHLDAHSNAVVAKGPGELVHLDPDRPAIDTSNPPALPQDLIKRTTLSWTKGMRYNNSSGEGEAVGDVVAVTYPDGFTQNTVKGAQVKILTAPSDPPGGTAPVKKTGEGDVLGGVKLLRAEAIGGSGDAGAPSRAIAEQRTYAADPGAPEGRRLVKMTYVEGGNLIADDQNGEFSVPGAGRALVLDHSASDAAAQRSGQASGSVFSSASARGTTLMEWSGTMVMRRATELADVSGGVRVTHKPLNTSSKPIVLTSDAVQAQFRLAKPGSPADQRDQLERVAARGTVRIVADGGDRELNADEASYDAQTETVEASATTEYGSVTFIDKTKGVPTIAKRMRWNVRTDEVTILEPMPVVIPTK